MEKRTPEFVFIYATAAIFAVIDASSRGGQFFKNESARRSQTQDNLDINRNQCGWDMDVRSYTGITRSQNFATGKHLTAHFSMRGLEVYEVPGTFNGIAVNALPDTGSRIDAVSENFARRHNLKIKRATTQTIRLLGGHIAESLGRTEGFFQFSGELKIHRREFHVLRKSVRDVVLGRQFLGEVTNTLAQYRHRIVKRSRPCLQKGNRLFLLEDSPKDLLPCKVNGIAASSFLDTGSDLMLVSGEFVLQNNLKVHRDNQFRTLVELIDGSVIYTDGMVLNARLQFEIAPESLPELSTTQYLGFLDEISSILEGETGAIGKTTFICDLHVIEDLPCDLILSDEFIFENNLFSLCKDLFSDRIANKPFGDDTMNCILFARNRSDKLRRLLPWIHREQDPQTMTPHQANMSWNSLWEAEAARRADEDLRIGLLSGSHKLTERAAETQRRELWDRNNPRPTAVAQSWVTMPTPPYDFSSPSITSSVPIVSSAIITTTAISTSSSGAVTSWTFNIITHKPTNSLKSHRLFGQSRPIRQRKGSAPSLLPYHTLHL